MGADYKTNDPRGWGGDPSRGAALGRSSIRNVGEDFNGRLSLQRVRLNSGGYDSLGTYFGIGEPLYWYADEEGDIDAVLRARDRADARRKVLALYPAAKVRK